MLAENEMMINHLTNLNGLETCPLKKADRRSLDFVIDHLFMKLFKTNNMSWIMSDNVSIIFKV